MPWPFLRFLGRRLVALVVLALGITFVAFVLTQLVPGDPALSALGPVTSADPEAVAAYHAHWGMDKPLPVQYLAYLWNLLHGDLGTSQLSHQPVLTDLQHAIPATMELAFLSIAFAIVVGVPLGVVAAIRQNRASDHALRVVSLAGISMPTFWLALLALVRLLLQARLVPRRRSPRPRDARRRASSRGSTPSMRCSTASGRWRGTPSTT